MADHELVQAAQLIYLGQPLEERAAVTHQRKIALRYFQKTRANLAADPTATADDLAVLDAYIRFSKRKLGWLPPEEEAARDERRRTKTRERVARWRAAKKEPARE
jgi:hypothetical protein